MTSRSENPIRELLALRRAREFPLTPARWARVVGLLYGGPALFFSLASRALTPELPLYDPFLWFLGSLGLMVMVSVPWLTFRADVSVLTSFRRGRCFEEVLGTLTTSADLVDGVMGHTLSSVARLCGPAALAVVPALLIHPDAHLRGPLFLSLVLWMAALLALTLIGSSLLLLEAAWTESGEGFNLPVAGAVGLAFGPGAALWTAAFRVPEGVAGAPGLALLGLGLAWTVLSARALARYGFAHYYEVSSLQRRLWSRLVRGRTGSVRPWSRNPVVVRECARESRATPVGGPAALLWRHGLALAAFPAFLAAGHLGRPHVAGLLDEAETLWIAFALFVAMQAVRAATRTVGASVDEREQGTWDALAPTPTAAAEWVDGWAQVGWVPRVRENLALAPLLWIPGLVPQASAGELLAAAGILVLAPVLGAYAGVAASTTVHTRSAAGRRLGTLLLAAAVPGLLFLPLATAFANGHFPCCRCARWSDVTPYQWPLVLLALAPLLAIACRRLAVHFWGARDVPDLWSHLLYRLLSYPIGDPDAPRPVRW